MTEKHSHYVDSWCQAMRHGLLTGRPYSENCIQAYKYSMTWFFGHLHTVSLASVK
jgi:hypothetical protein